MNVESKIKVFVSHKKEDKAVALHVVDYLKRNGLDAYIDALDREINPKNVTERIVANLRDSTHLIVIYSDYTRYSEWVPFELGVGYERDEGIGVLKHNLTGWLPSYLNEFPVMNDIRELDKFIALCKKDRTSCFCESFDDISRRECGYARHFITDLKTDIIRGRYAY
ncbi:MAG: toll/interleukin-1 receptor domain-containing protein [Fibrobacter sp.]|nr:toll/interleukin-1 receptor domain-containing protein [Fibrobacter sp.]